MKSTAIKLTWVQAGKKYEKELNREDLYAVFCGLAAGFRDDNTISQNMIQDIIPYADEIFINKDFNETQNVPTIVYFIDDDKSILKIMRYHKIVWSILDKLCTE